MERNKIGGGRICSKSPSHRWLWVLWQSLHNLRYDAVGSCSLPGPHQIQACCSTGLCEGWGSRNPLPARRWRRALSKRGAEGGWGQVSTSLEFSTPRGPCFSIFTEDSSAVDAHVLGCCLTPLTFLCKSLDLWLQLPGRIWCLWRQKFIVMKNNTKLQVQN